MEFFEELTDALMRRSGFSILVSIGVACVAGCGVQMPAGHAPAPELEAATYSGTIPCASCPGIHIVLTLFPDSTFRLRQTYLEAEDGRDQHFYELGRWMRAHDDRARLLLRDGTEGIWQVRFLADGVLRMLDTEGNEIQSELSYDLTPQPRIDPVSGPCSANSSWNVSPPSAWPNGGSGTDVP